MCIYIHRKYSAFERLIACATEPSIAITAINSRVCASIDCIDIRRKRGARARFDVLSQMLGDERLCLVEPGQNVDAQRVVDDGAWTALPVKCAQVAHD